MAESKSKVLINLAGKPIKSGIMRNTFCLLGLILILAGCRENGQEAISTEKKITDYENFGEDFDTSEIVSAEEMSEKYTRLKAGDTLQVSFEAKVNRVCKMKGCWMVLDLPGDQDPRVSFADYGFFVPKDIEGREAMVSGKAYIEEVSVEDQRHFAKDAGKTDAEISMIRNRQIKLAFVANGVKLKK